MIKQLICGSVRNKLLMVTGLGTALVLATTLFGIYKAYMVELEMTELLHHEQTLQSEFQSITQIFRAQLNDWKNTLLTERDSQLLNNNWLRFNKDHRNVDASVDVLIADVGDQKIISMLQQFKQLHTDMLPKYTAAYNAFLENYNSIESSRAVAGLEDKPIELLADIQHALEASVKASIENAHEKSVVSIQITLLSLGLAVVISFVLFIVMVQKNIITPARSLVDDFTRMANGDFSGSITVHSSDEIGQVASAAEKLQSDIGELVESINQSVYSVSTAAEEMSHVSDRANQAMVSQRQETDQVATAMNEMTATVHEVSQNAQLAADSANQASTEVNTGQKVVNDAIRAIGSLVQKVEQASDVIHNLENDSVEIGSVLDVIRSIAEQTNLLALNAAIEAARAGEQGRGFAVVADEVRVLAQRTQTSTEEIQTMIERLQAGAQEAVESMNQSRSQADTTRDTAAEAGKVLTSITSAVTNINDMNALIASAAEEQNAVAEEINRNIVNISQASENTAESVASTAKSSEDLRNVAEELKHVVSRLRV